MDLDPRYMQAFYEVARTRSFSRAAQLLHKTQPTVSYQIRQLEQQLSTRLFDRTTKTLVRTPAGDRLFELCERFFGELAQFATARPPPLRIASVSAFGRYVLFPVLQRLDQPYSLHFPTGDAVLASLYAGTTDLGFVYRPLVSNRLHVTQVADEELVVIAPPRTRALPTSVDDFATIPFVTYDEHEYVFGRWFDAVFHRQPSSLTTANHFEELEEVVASVAGGHGWSIIPASAARHTKIMRHPRHRVTNAIYAVTRTLAHPAAASVISTLARRIRVTRDA